MMELDFAKLVICVITQESGWNPKAISEAGAMGLMQLMRPTANDMAAELGIEKYNILDPKTNIKFGTRYLKKCLKWMGDDIRLALCCYNYGVGNVRRLQKMCGDAFTAIEVALPEETKQYVKRIMENYESE